MKPILYDDELIKGSLGHLSPITASEEFLFLSPSQNLSPCHVVSEAPLI